jgi:penicillin amidase
MGLMIVIIVGIYAYLRSTLPEYDGEITVPGIKAPVEIMRDAYGMPHIYAQTDEDAYFAVGFCMAQDRLFHIDMARRLAKGRLAEIIGKDLVSVDKFFRTISTADIGRRKSLCGRRQLLSSASQRPPANRIHHLRL